MFREFSLFNRENGFDFSISKLTLFFCDRQIKKIIPQADFPNNLNVDRSCRLIAIFFYIIVVVIDSSRLLLEHCQTSRQHLYLLYVLITGAGFTFFTVIYGNQYPIYNFAGIIFCLLFCCTFIRLTFCLGGDGGTYHYNLLYGMCRHFCTDNPTNPFQSFFYMTGLNTLGMMVCYFQKLLTGKVREAFEKK